MHLSPRDIDKLLLHNAGVLAQKRLARGVRLNYPEAVALIATQLLAITGLLLAGGLLLLWVCWKMWEELRISHKAHNDAMEALTGEDLNQSGGVAGTAPRKTMRQAVTQIVVADVSMSLDNVLAVAGAAHEHPTVLVFGLVLSVALMGLASSWIAGLLNKHRWIAWVGLVVILYVALNMVYEGWHDISEHGLPWLGYTVDAPVDAPPAPEAAPEG